MATLTTSTSSLLSLRGRQTKKVLLGRSGLSSRSGSVSASAANKGPDYWVSPTAKGVGLAPTLVAALLSNINALGAANAEGAATPSRTGRHFLAMPSARRPGRTVSPGRSGLAAGSLVGASLNGLTATSATKSGPLS